MADADLRNRIANALRDAAKPCTEDGTDPVACDAAHPIEAAVLHFDVVTDVWASVDALAELTAGVVQAELDRVAAERDGAYRERAQLLAELASRYPAVVAPAPDVDEPGWTLLYVTLPTGQASWHQHPRDADLFGHVEHVPAGDPRAQWDGHTTAEKYQRLAALAPGSRERAGD